MGRDRPGAFRAVAPRSSEPTVRRSPMGGKPTSRRTSDQTHTTCSARVFDAGLLLSIAGDVGLVAFVALEEIKPQPVWVNQLEVLHSTFKHFDLRYGQAPQSRFHGKRQDRLPRTLDDLGHDVACRPPRREGRTIQ